MTPEELDEIERRAEEATPGPWKIIDHLSIWSVDIQEDDPAFGPYDDGVPICDVSEQGGRREDDNAGFLAHARTDIPALCSSLRAAWAEIERLKDAVYQAEADRTVALDIARTITDEKIERGARASFNYWIDNAVRKGRRPEGTGGEFEDMSPDEQVFALGHIRAVLEAVKEGG